MRFIAAKALLSFLAVGASAIPVLAEDPLSVRVAQREQALALLGDSDPLVRLGALEDIFTQKDAVLKTLAAKRALASTDKDLRTLALRYTLSIPGRQYNFVVSKCEGKYCYNFTKPAYFFRIKSMDFESGQFLIYADGDEGRARTGRLMNGSAVFGVVVNGSYDFVGQFSTLNGSSYTGTISWEDRAILSGSIDLY